MRITWEDIRTLGKVKYFNISYLVLFAVPFLYDFYTILFHYKFGITEFPLNLKILYGASLSYALAIALYQFFCPSIIRRHASEHDYVNSYFDIDKDIFLDKKLGIVLSNLTEAQKETDELIQDLYQRYEQELDPKSKAELNELLNENLNLVYEGCIKRYLLKEYNSNLTKNCLAIYIAGLFYSIGSITLICLLVEKSIEVFSIT